MNSLSLGFLYVIGVTWLLCEVCVSASGGNWTPLWLYLVGFTVMFAVLGCLPLSTRAIEIAGPIFAILIGVGILAYGFSAFGSGFTGGFIRTIGGLALVTLGVIGFSYRKSEEAH
jgi:hypothetical protein